MSVTLRYSLFLIALIGVATGIMLMPGKYVVTFHIGDILHALEASLRIVDGEVPHLDFMTPIGILAFAPISVFLALGFGPGASLVLANMLVSLVLLPAIIRVGTSRLQGSARWIFGAVMVVLLMAFVYGGTNPGVSFSMHYNRWAWAITFLVLITAIWPPRVGRDNPVVDAVLIGGGMAVLALMKMTFFMSFGAVVLVILLMDRQFRLLGFSALVGLAVAAGVTILFGMDYWFAYADNLLQVALHSPRPNPDRPLLQTLVDPDRKLGTLAYLGAIILFRMTGRKRAGLILLLLASAFVYVVYQNWGNEQKWLLFLGLFLAANLPKEGVRSFFGIDARQIGKTLVVVVATTAIPTLLALSSSILGAVQVDEHTMAPYPFAHLEQDIWLRVKGDFVLATTSYHPTEAQLQLARTGNGNMPFAIHRFQGETLPYCGMYAGFVRYFSEALELISLVPGASGAAVIMADNVNPLWLVSDVARVSGTSPWYYSGTYGFENADYFLVPSCPLLSGSRKESLQAMESTDWTFTEVGRSDQFLLYKIER